MKKSILLSFVLLMSVGFALAQESQDGTFGFDEPGFEDAMPFDSGGVSPIRWWTCYVKDAPNVEYVGREYGRVERAQRAAFRQCHEYSRRPSTCRLLRCR